MSYLSLSNPDFLFLNVRNSLPRKVEEVFKSCVDVTLRDLVSGHGRNELELDMILVIFSNLNDSMILFLYTISTIGTTFEQLGKPRTIGL